MDEAHATLQIFLNRFNDPQPVRNSTTSLFESVLEHVPSHETYDSLAVACVYKARLTHGISTPSQEIVDTVIPMEKLYNSMNVINQATELAREQKFKPEYMGKFCIPLHLPEAVQASATKIYMKAVELNFVTEPEVNAFAAAAAYKACQASDSPKTVLEIGEAVSVSEGDILQASEKLLILPSFM